MQIRLERAGKVLHEVNSSQIAADIEIGRSSTCKWVVPSEETVVGGRHALLFRKRRAVWIKDMDSKNGVFYRGKRIDKRKLRPGDRVNVGTCVVLVDRDNEAGAEKQLPQIIISSGPSHGQKKDILRPGIMIGSDPEGDVVLLDPVVSRRHAEIRVQDNGACWIKDLKSKNGTKVNDVPLLPEQERMLKDGDTISVAHLEVVFHDGASKRVAGQALRRLGLMAATLVIAGAAYWGVKMIQPSAIHLLDNARKLAEKGLFSDAANCLEGAIHARGYEAIGPSIDKLRNDLDRWSVTLKKWEDAKHALETENWTDASQFLGSSGKDDWSWGPAGVDLRKEWLKVKGWLALTLQASQLAEQKDTPSEVLISSYDSLTNSLEDAQSNERPYTRLLTGYMQKISDGIRETLGAYAKLDGELEKLKAWPVEDWESVRNGVVAIAKSSTGTLQIRATLIVERFGLLDPAYKSLVEASRLARDMKFGEAKEKTVDVPSPDVCAIDPHLAIFRSNLENAVGNLRSQAEMIASLTGVFTNHFNNHSFGLGSIEYWKVSQSMEGVLGCDCLRGPYRRMGRSEPLPGEYDRALHVEGFADYLKTLAGRAATQTEPPAFPTALGSAEELVSEAEALIRYLSAGDHAWLLQGPLRGVWNDAHRVLAAREAAAEAMLLEVKRSTGRRRIIAGALALRFSREPPKIADTPLDAVVVAEMKDIETTVRKLDQEYGDASDSKQIDIRRQILTVGIPGLFPTVDKMWRQEDAAASRK